MMNVYVWRMYPKKLPVLLSCKTKVEAIQAPPAGTIPETRLNQKLTPLLIHAERNAPRYIPHQRDRPLMSRPPKAIPAEGYNGEPQVNLGSFSIKNPNKKYNRAIIKLSIHCSLISLLLPFNSSMSLFSSENIPVWLKFLLTFHNS